MKFVENNLDNIDWKRVSNLFECIGWGYRSPEKIEESFRASSHSCFFYTSDNELIAFGRTVDDGIYYALLVDVVVHPDFQGKGLGRKIVDYLKSKLAGYNFITLTAAPEKDGFYKKLGWKRQKSAFLWPKDEKQILLHCIPDTENNSPV